MRKSPFGAAVFCIAILDNVSVFPPQPATPVARITPSQEQNDTKLKARIATADLVVVGRVRSVQPGPEPAYDGEHRPDLQDAIVEVHSVIKGLTHPNRVVVRFAASLDVAWYRSPKLKPGEEHIFILKKNEVSGTPAAIANKVPQVAYIALDPCDVLSKDDLDRVLIAARNASQVWFTPDFGSPDLTGLFSRPEQWRKARSQISVMKFYLLQLLLPSQSPCQFCGSNRIPAFARSDAFRKLSSWGIDVAVEGAVGLCENGSYSLRAMRGGLIQMKWAYQNVAQNGGQLRYIALDEPFFHGPERCHATQAEVVNSAISYRRSVLEFWPSALIGEIEPYPALSAGKIESTIEDLERGGFRPAFFQLDINFPFVDRRPDLAKAMPRDLKKLKAFFERQSIPFGIIFWSGKDPVDSDQEYYQLTLRNLRLVKSAIGVPAISNFQSWVAGPDGSRNVPHNLPEGVAGTHTSLINEGMKELEPETARSAVADAWSGQPSNMVPYSRSVCFFRTVAGWLMGLGRPRFSLGTQDQTSPPNLRPQYRKAFTTQWRAESWRDSN